MVVDGLVTQGTKASAMIFTYFAQNNLDFTW